MEAPADLAAERGRWRLTFWLVFWLTPFLVIAAGLWAESVDDLFPAPLQRFFRSVAPAPTRVLGTLAVGALAAGYCLARLYAKPTTMLGIITGSVLFAFGILIIYASIVFVGCLMVAPFF